MRLWALVETSNGALLPLGPQLDDPQVTGVVTTDLIEPGRYLAGGELVLTGLAWWRPRRPDRTAAFVEALRQARVAALAAGDAELGRVPADLMQACAEAGLPLLRVPVTVSFGEIHELVNRQLAPSRQDDLAAVLARHRELMTSATAGAGIAHLLDLLARDLGLPARVFSSSGRLVAGDSSDDDGPELARAYLRAPRLPHLVRGVSLFGPASGRSAAWVLAVAEDHTGWDPHRAGVVAELASLVALECGLAARRSAAEDHLATTLLAAAAPAEIMAAVRRCGVDPEADAVLIAGEGPDAAPVLAELLIERAELWRLGSAGADVVALVVEAEPAELLLHVRAGLAELAPGLTGAVRLGVSDRVRGADGLLAGLAVARAVAATEAGTGVAGPERLSSHGLLLAAVPSRLRAAYRDQVLGQLIEHDRVHRTELVRTLATYLECSGSWSRCAAVMHVHVNTLRYRIERIEALTGRDLRSLADQIDLVLALAADL